MTEAELYKELGALTKEKDRWEESIPYEFTSIDQFLSQYTGEWGPSDGHWYGLDFSWNGCKYRFHTGAMYESEPLTLPDGRDADFGVYRKLDNPVGGHEYELIGKYATTAEAVKQCIIDGISLAEIIVHPDTELLGQD